MPAILLQQKHSRDFEREADRYAIDMMLANGEPLEPMAALFERMSMHGASPQPAADDEEEDEEEEQAPAPAPSGNAPSLNNYFSSHPSDAERIATLRAADRNK